MTSQLVLAVASLLVMVITVFWLAVSFGFWLTNGLTNVFATSFKPDRDLRESPDGRRVREAFEMETMERDIEEVLRVRQLRANRNGGGAPTQETLLNLGVALNDTLARQDADNVKRGDHWLSAGRPFLFGLIQFLLAIVPILLLGKWLSLEQFLPWLGTTIGTVLVVSVLIGIMGYTTVRPNWILAVTRFDEHASFLRPGLQFIVPFFEKRNSVPLSNLVWGPGGGDDDDDSAHKYHIPGSSRHATNPSPGVFQVTLRGRYPLDIVVKIVLRVRRSSMASWYRFLYEFASPAEIGELIGDITQGVFTTKSREVKVGEAAIEDAPDNIGPILLDFLNRVPEITGTVLLALQGVSRERLGGLLPVSVSIAAAVPDSSYQEMLRKLDLAKVARREQQLAGEGLALRWQESVGPYIRYLDALTPAQRAMAETLNERDIQLEIAKKPSGLDAVLSAWAKSKATETQKSK